MTFDKTGCETQGRYFLLLAESRGINFFKRLQKGAGSTNKLQSWTVEVLEEDLSLAVRHDDYSDFVLTVVAGRQLVTREKLELLALITDTDFPDGIDLQGSVEAVAAAGGIGVCPWGAGKWLGKRGKVLQKYMGVPQKGPFFLGDSGGRPLFWPRPSLCSNDKFAATLVSGSDPLPIRGEELRVGSFGGIIAGDCDLERPAAGLREMLLDNVKITGFGSLMSPFSFLRNQIVIRL